MEFWRPVIFLFLIPICCSQTPGLDWGIPDSRKGGSYRKKIVTFQNNVTQEGDLMVAAVVHVLSTHEHLIDCSISVIAMGTSSFAASFVSAFVDALVSQERPYQVMTQDDEETWTYEPWRTSNCNAYLLVAPNASSFQEVLEHLDDSWDWGGFYLLVSLSTVGQMSEVVASPRLRKTHHLLIVIPGPRRFQVALYTLTLLGADPRALVFQGLWTPARSMSGTRQLFPDKMGDLGGQPLTVLSFNHPPSVFSTIDASGFLRGASGIDIKVVRWLGRALNFVPVFEFSGPELWGDLLENGSYSGIVGRISRGDAEMGVGNLFITEKRAKHITYSFPYDFERACFLTPAPRPKPTWMALTFPFTPIVWGLSVACLGVLSVLVPLFGRALLKKDHQVLHSPLGAFLLPLAAFTNQSFILPRRPPMQVLVSVIILCGFVVTIFFSCNLTAFLTVTAVEKPLTRISQIVESDLLVGGFSNFWLEIFSGSSDDNLRSLAKKYFSFFPDIMPHLKRVAAHEVVLIENSQHLEYLRTTFYMDSRGRSPLRLMEECSHPHGIGALLKKNSPLKPAIDKAILRMHAGGWVNRFFEEVLVEDHGEESLLGTLEGDLATWAVGKGKDSAAEENTPPLTLEHLQGAFLCLGFGLSGALVVLLIELALVRLLGTSKGEK